MFITFEGSEGTGKSTQLPSLAEFLRQAGFDVLVTREPGGSPIGEQIRTVIMDLQNTAMQPRTEILLLQASRAQHVEQVIRPHLDRGGLVLCDRFGDSTLAYQGYGYCQFDLEILRNLVAFATAGLTPDLTILLDMDVEEGLLRRERKGGVNRLDTYDLEFYQRVRQGYLELARQQPARWVTIDASLPAAQVQELIRRSVMERLKG
jgi:dTMP kinase